MPPLCVVVKLSKHWHGPPIPRHDVFHHSSQLAQPSSSSPTLSQTQLPTKMTISRPLTHSSRVLIRIATAAPHNARSFAHTARLSAAAPSKNRIYTTSASPLYICPRVQD